MCEDSFTQKRQFYRLKYPKRARPVMRIKDELFHVSEVSEKGIRLIMSKLNPVYRGLSMVGSLRLHSNYNIDISGSVLRQEGDEVIIKLSKGPSFKDMVSEQRRIRQRYPVFFASLRVA
ncbi:PilZ domain-containing protein [Vibrio artabrorum]|uniref:PilZ domain-containing protein n=1 Tax=Vibrio artabrorum TaxID=446374 RepID=A0ABT8CGW5_9VIBR|nr:PilZ domain-containing protein [Vibrio artabrorum]MDN3699794.1 PilZ domain-containing protein [Vibrio artabrorum]